MSEIKLYHGTGNLFKEVDLLHSKNRKDFGFGFYLTSDYNQAKNWAITIASNNSSVAYVNMYKIDTSKLSKLRQHKFNKASREWVKYIIRNRYATNDKYKDYDVVIGKVADARANIIINKYIAKYGVDGCLNETEIQDALIIELHPERLVDQYCFKTECAISLLNKRDSNGNYEVSIKKVIR